MYPCFNRITNNYQEQMVEKPRAKHRMIYLSFLQSLETKNNR